MASASIKKLATFAPTFRSPSHPTDSAAVDTRSKIRRMVVFNSSST